MTLSRLWRGALAAPVAAVLVTGGALLTASPAVAAPGTLVVTSPAPSAVLASRSFDVTGTGTDGAIIDIASTGADLVVTPLGTTVVSGGTFTVPVAFAASADTSQTLLITQSLASAPTDADVASVQITLPAPPPTPPSGAITITSPQDGSTAGSRSVTFEGTAPAGSILTVDTNQAGLIDIIPTITVDSSGAFSLPLFFGPAVTSPVTVTFGGSDANGAALVDVDVTITLPDAAPAPVITAPTMTSIVGPSVAVSGTGVAGQNVAVAVLPADPATLEAAANLDAAALIQVVPVDAQGGWTARFSLPLGSYTATALHVDGATATAVPISLPSNVVSFTLVAPPVTAAANTTPVTPVLAETGFEDAGLVGPAALVLLVGGALMVTDRRRALAEARR